MIVTSQNVKFYDEDKDIYVNGADNRSKVTAALILISILFLIAL